MPCHISITICGGHHNALRRPSATGMAADQQPCSRTITFVQRSYLLQWLPANGRMAGMLRQVHSWKTWNACDHNLWLKYFTMALPNLSKTPWQSGTLMPYPCFLSPSFKNRPALSSTALPAFQFFFLIGISPNKILACLSPSFCLPLKGSGLTFRFRSIAM